MKKFINTIDTICVLISGMIFSSVFISDSLNWKYYLPVLLILITVRNFVKK